MRYAVALLLLGATAFARDQSVGARGQLMCGDKPLADAVVKLWELDTWPDPDDELMKVNTDSSGRFEVFGTENEILSISPVLKIYHRCNNKGLFSIPNLCKRKTTYEIPKSYINSGRAVGKWYEMGVMNMEAKTKGEGTECIQL